MTGHDGDEWEALMNLCSSLYIFVYIYAYIYIYLYELDLDSRLTNNVNIKLN